MDTIDSVFIDLEGQIKHLSGSAVAGQVISVLFLFFVFLWGGGLVAVVVFFF